MDDISLGFEFLAAFATLLYLIKLLATEMAGLHGSAQHYSQGYSSLWGPALSKRSLHHQQVSSRI
ncbi:MAG: hypothetical protein K1X83_00040 [Oligoflexia bacterium]|nr:hypothetical protein [Oligoflexia bacterium]